MAFLGNKRNVRTAHRSGAMTTGYFGTTAVWNPARFLRSRTWVYRGAMARGR
ncbi:hypothetical protein BW23_1565 [Burkholderia ubonensis MSMB22]|nr:hypothetical protein BW23_1565 [Burkholderia ubonensis MSMB22]